MKTSRKTALVPGLIVSLLFALTSLASARGFTWVTNNGTITITGYTGPYGPVSIPNLISGLPVTRIGNGAFSVFGGNSPISSIKIAETVTSIGDFAFEESMGLTEVTIGKGVVTIGYGAFSCCDNLSRITVDPLNTVYSSRDGVLFNKQGTTLIYCPIGKADETYTIPEGVIVISPEAFRRKHSLTNVVIPNTVTIIGDLAFEDCFSLVEMIIPNGVTNIGKDAFNDCGNIRSLVIPDSVTTIGSSAFYGCAGLTSVTIPDGVTAISAFAYCSRLVSVTLPKSLVSIGGYSFLQCSSLTNVTIPPGVKELGQRAFDQCTGLSSPIVIPDSVTNIGESAFRLCTNLRDVAIGNAVQTISPQAFEACSSLTNVTIGSNVSTIGMAAFRGCPLPGISIPRSTIDIAPDALQDCFNLRNITVDPLNPMYASVDGVLFNASQTTLIKCPEAHSTPYLIPDTVTNIGNRAFSSCTSLSSVAIPNSVTTLGEYAFSGSGLRELRIPGNVTIIPSHAFEACHSLTNVSIPDSVTSIETAAFRWCSSLVSVTMGCGVTNLGGWAFFRNLELAEIYFKGNAPSIGSAVFDYDDHPTVYYLPGRDGWSSTFAGRPAKPWVLPNPVILYARGGIKAPTPTFGFRISWATNAVVVVEASSSLTIPEWFSVGTNALIGGWSDYSDPWWTNYPTRFYRVRP